MSPWTQTLGGIGLFLFGMALMTSGLRKIAGARLRHWLGRSTRNTLSGVFTGAVMTAIVQSSSATTLAAIGFVGAGLITFTQALGIIFGANIGTTFKGWVVALLGFNLPIENAALPLLFVASLLYLANQSRVIRGSGKALAGFCLLFIGLSWLQNGLAGFRDVIDLSHWAGNTIGGRLGLLFAGVALTILTQSSSVTVAAALTALNTGIVDLPQAASVIIGADIGTTATAALATIGGSAAIRRTGFAHVIFNLLSGALAFSILPLFLFGAEKLFPGPTVASPEVIAVAFHTFFNFLGVVLILPFTEPFARLLERLFPETVAPLCAAFDRSLLSSPETAGGSLETGSRRLAEAVLRQAALTMDPSLAKGGLQAESFPAILDAAQKAREFAIQIGAKGSEETPAEIAQILDCIHLIDHVERLAERASDQRRAAAAKSSAVLRRRASETALLLRDLGTQISANQLSAATAQAIAVAAEKLESDTSGFRQHSIRDAVSGKLAADELDAVLDAQRWLRRIAYHASRIAHYAQNLAKTSPT